MKTIITLLIGLLASTSLFAQGLPNERHIIISGHGYVERMPDYVEIQLSINKTSPNLKTSKDIVDRITQQTLDAALANGVATEDIGASKIHAQPDFEWADGKRQYLGEKISRSVTLTLRDLSRYSALVQAVINADVSRLHGTQLKFNDRSAIEYEAMELAISDAKKKAEVIAQQFGAELGEVYKISETAISDGTYSRSHQYEMEVGMVSSSGSGKRAELKIKKQRVDEAVFVVFLLE